jgi:hypothetical protein
MRSLALLRMSQAASQLSACEHYGPGLEVCNQFSLSSFVNLGALVFLVSSHSWHMLTATDTDIADLPGFMCAGAKRGLSSRTASDCFPDSHLSIRATVSRHTIY